MLRALPCLALLVNACGPAAGTEEEPKKPDPCTEMPAHALVKGLPNTSPDGINFKLDSVIGLFDESTSRGSFGATETYDSTVNFSLFFDSPPSAGTSSAPPSMGWPYLHDIEVKSEVNGPTWAITDPAATDYVLQVDSVCPSVRTGQTQKFILHGKATATLKPENSGASGNLDAVVTF
ncbi:MAG: hypothetical protein QM723_25245 [Myxococcaceae bacterium]